MKRRGRTCVISLVCVASVLAIAMIPAAAQEDSALTAFEHEQLQRCDRALAEARWPDAARALEVLQLLRPASVEYREQAAALAGRIDELVAALWRLAQDEQRQGRIERAQRGYLQLLWLKPDHAGAASALRSFEREASSRSLRDRGPATFRAEPPARPWVPSSVVR